MLLRNLERKLSKTGKQLEKAGVQTPKTHSDSYVTERVLEMDAVPEVTRVGKQYTHVSALIGVCPRRHIISHIHGLERVKAVSPSMRLVWALGRAAEHHVRTQFIEAVNKFGVIGIWACKCGYLKSTGLYSEVVAECPRCRSKNSTYKESPLFDHEARITGSPDMMYMRPDNQKIRVVECKSINKAEFEKLKAPKKDHIHQAMAYNELLRINGLSQDDSVTIIYVCKDFQFKSPYHEFHVERSEEHEKVISLMWQNANLIAKAIRDKAEDKEVVVPDRLVSCSSTSSTTAKSCDCVGACFAMNN